MRRSLIIIALLCAATAALAQSLSFPALTGRVVDDAGVLDAATRESLRAKLAALEAKTTDQVVVATVTSLQGVTIEAYANALFKQWRLGQADKNNGVLLLVAPNERRVRIEVGYGLEGALPNARARDILGDVVKPHFKSGDFIGGVEAGADAILAAARAKPATSRDGNGSQRSHGEARPLPLPGVVVRGR